MWVFLATEVLFFGGLFCGYAVYRFMYPAEFIAGSHKLDEWLGAINTAVLLTSSLTMVLAVYAAQRNRRGWIILNLLLTLLLGASFLGAFDCNVGFMARDRLSHYPLHKHSILWICLQGTTLFLRSGE